MFRENKKLTGTDTLIGQGTMFEGTIHTEANLRIEGQFKGAISSQGDVIVGEYGISQSEIVAHSLTIAGHVIGDVSIYGRLIITSSGSLEGNAKVQSIIIQEGGTLNGLCHMLTEQELKQREKAMSSKQEQPKTKELLSEDEKKKAKQAG